MVRGDLIEVGGTGLCVVEAVFYQGGEVKINIRPQASEGIINGIPETECDIVDAITILKKAA